MGILAASDFASGNTKIAGNGFSDADLTASLSEEWENEQIKLMLGNTEGLAFIADLSGGEPQTAKYITIFNEFSFAIGGHPYRCIGIKKILTYLFYFEYTTQQENVNTGSGNKTIESEAARPLMYSMGQRLYNEARDNADILQGYCIENRDTYTDFKLVHQYPYAAMI
jgi:hypothetical protein